MFAACSVAPKGPSHAVTFLPDPAQKTTHSISKIVGKRQNEPFTLCISGSHAPSDFDFIFPERANATQALSNSDMDLAVYDQAFSSLSSVEALTVRGWSPVGYSDAEGGDDYRIGTPTTFSSFNLDINRRLARASRLTAPELITSHNLSSALKKLPTVSGDFVCLVEHEPDYPAPWGSAIFVDDVVSCDPCFLPALATLRSAEHMFSFNTFLNPTRTDTVAIYKICAQAAISTAVPLLNGAGEIQALEGEKPVLFSQNSCFRVDGIATAEPADQASTSASSCSMRRIGVILTQVEPQTKKLKNMLTGLDVTPFSLERKFRWW